MFWMVLVGWLLPEVLCQGTTDLYTPTDLPIGNAEWESTGTPITTTVVSSSTPRNPPQWTYDNPTRPQEPPRVPYYGSPNVNLTDNGEIYSYRETYHTKDLNLPYHPMPVVYYTNVLPPENSRYAISNPASSNAADDSKRNPSATSPEPILASPYPPDINGRVESRTPIADSPRLNPYNYPFNYPPLFYPFLNGVPTYTDYTSLAPTNKVEDNPVDDDFNPEAKQSAPRALPGPFRPTYNLEDIPLSPNSEDDIKLNSGLENSIPRSLAGYPVLPFGQRYSPEDIPLSTSSSELRSNPESSAPRPEYPVPPFGQPFNQEDLPLSSSSSELNSRPASRSPGYPTPPYGLVSPYLRPYLGAQQDPRLLSRGPVNPLDPFGLMATYPQLGYLPPILPNEASGNIPPRPYPPQTFPPILPNEASGNIPPRPYPPQAFPPILPNEASGAIPPRPYPPQAFPPRDQILPNEASDTIPPRIVQPVGPLVAPYPGAVVPPAPVSGGVVPPAPVVPNEVIAEKEAAAIAQSEGVAEPSANTIPYDFGYQMNDGRGTDQYRQESKDGSGTVSGSYGYRDNDGVYRTVLYVADQNGFRAQVQTNEPGVANPGSADVRVIAEPPPPATAEKSLVFKIDQEHLPVPVESLVGPQ